MGGTKILSALINSEEGIVKKIKRPTDPEAGGKAFVNLLAKMVKKTVNSGKVSPEQVKAVCLGVPGAVNPFSGEVIVAPNIGLKNFNIKKELEKKIPYPVLIENDVNLGALGIKHFGVGKNSKDMLAAFIGTGIGGGLILDEKIFRGANFAAGEIGHINVVKNGPLCGCGKHGCLEAVASRAAIANNILKDIKAKKKTIIKVLMKPGQQIKSKTLAAAVKKRDKLVIKHITDACRIIGTVLADITNLLNLDLIVLGGGLIEALDKFMMPVIREAFEINVFPASRNVKILPSKLGDDAALYGGISLAEEFLDIKV